MLCRSTPPYLKKIIVLVVTFRGFIMPTKYGIPIISKKLNNIPDSVLEFYSA